MEGTQGQFSDELKIIQSDYYSFNEYREVVDKYLKTDIREINFQDRVIMRLLERILINEDDIFVVDVHSQYKNKESNTHERTYYAGKHTPDLLVARNWNYDNKKMMPADYIAILEVKSPVLDPISRDVPHTSEEIEEYLQIIDRVILTDCFIWKFYVSPKTKPRTFVLHDGNGWKMKRVGYSDFVQTELGFEKYREEPAEWEEFIGYLKDFLLHASKRVKSPASITRFQT